jgi:hypothetical protein
MVKIQISARRDFMNKTVRMPMDMHNVFIVCKPGEEYMDRFVKPVVSSTIRPLIEKLQMHRPGWAFIADDFGAFMSTDNHYRHSRFKIDDYGEELGVIGLESSNHGSPYFAMQNHRIKVNRTRTRRVKTRDLDKAVGIVLKSFYVKTISERLNEAVEQAHSMLRNTLHGHSYDFEREVRKVQEPLFSHLAQNPHILDAIALPDASAQETLRKAAEKQVMHRAVFGIDAAKNVSRIVTVSILSDAIYAVSSGEAEPEKYSYDTMPPYMATGVGMLKLMDVGCVIDGVGIRTSDNTFIIIK